MKSKIAIIGEFKPTSRSHITLNEALDHIKTSCGLEFDPEWIDTARVESEGEALLRSFAGIWSPPGGAFKSLRGTLQAIQYAREHDVPHLATCGGFQHTIVEFARNLQGIDGAQHEEYEPAASNLVISRLTCSLVGLAGKVYIRKGTRAYASYGVAETEEDFFCSFGINPQFRERLTNPQLVFSGTDEDQDIRIAELQGHKFFLATLYVPQTRSTPDVPHPLIRDFIKAAVED